MSLLDRSFQRFDPVQQAQLEAIALVREDGASLTSARSNDMQELPREATQITFRDNLIYRVNEHNQHLAPYKHDLGYSRGREDLEDRTGQEDRESQKPSFSAPHNDRHLLSQPDLGENYELPAGWRMMGYLKNTYIFFETHEGLEIIEQHIAHERTLYERLLAQQNAETPGRLSENIQKLVVSAPLDLTSDQADVLRNSSAALTRLGFEFIFDDAGRPSVAQLPLQLAQIDYVSVIQKMVEDIATADATNMELEATKSLACQSAIKNGMPLSPARRSSK